MQGRKGPETGGSKIIPVMTDALISAVDNSC